MKDSSVSANEIEQKKFSFGLRPTQQKAASVTETPATAESSPAAEYEATSDVIADVSGDGVIPTAYESEQRHLPGTLLCAERKRRGFTIKEVAAQLFLTETQIKSLEADHYDHFPAPIFVTGYIRNYARLLELPPDPLVELFTTQGVQSAPKLNRVTRTGSSIKESKASFDPRIVGGVVAVVVLVPLLWWAISPSDNTATAPDEMVGSEGDLIDVPVEVVAPPALASISLPEVNEPPVASEEVVATASAAGIDLPPATDSLVPPEFIVDRAQAEALPDKLELTFTAESWIEITDANGRQVMFDLGKAGQTRALSGTAPFKVLLGYSPAVSMVYNGEPFDQSRYARGKVARFTLE